MKKLLIIFLSTIPFLFLSGCADKLELEQHAYAIAIGLDINEHDDHLIDVTFQIANPQVGSTKAGEAPNEPASDIATFTASDIYSAKELANSVVTRQVSFEHLQTIIVGEKLAETDLFHHVISSAMIDPQMRLENTLIVSKEPARDFIHANQPELETRPHKYFFYMKQRWKDTGYVPLSTLNRYFQRMSGELFLAIYATTEKNEEIKQSDDQYIAGQIPQKSGDPVQMMGSAVFKNGKMIGTLTGEETRMALFLRSKALSHYIIESFPDPIYEDYRISAQIGKNKNTKIKINVQTDIPKVQVTVPVKLYIFSNTSLTNYTTNLENQHKLKAAIENHLEQMAMEFVEKTQDEYESEPFLWYLQARQQFWTIDEYRQYNWEEKYANAIVNVKFDATIESLGSQIKPENIHK